MADRIVLLTPPVPAHHLGAFVRRLNPRATVTRARDRAELDALCTPGTLLIGFCTPVIVPRRILDRLGRPAYNFHPGPPNHPGVRPEAFALYGGDAIFGATAHVMAPKVDTGAIVGVEWFEVPAGADQRRLGDEAFAACIRLFARLAQPLACADAPLPVSDLSWAPRAWTFADYDALRRIPADCTAEEIHRRIRCTHADPDRPTSLQSGDLRFNLWAPPPGV